MTLEITLGWWVIPILATIASFVFALWGRPGESGGFIPSPAPLFRFVAALILSMAYWIAYLLVILACRP